MKTTDFKISIELEIQALKEANESNSNQILGTCLLKALNAISL
jgi:hypothetical protein